MFVLPKCLFVMLAYFSCEVDSCPRLCLDTKLDWPEVVWVVWMKVGGYEECVGGYLGVSGGVGERGWKMWKVETGSLGAIARNNGTYIYGLTVIFNIS